LSLPRGKKRVGLCCQSNAKPSEKEHDLKFEKLKNFGISNNDMNDYLYQVAWDLEKFSLVPHCHIPNIFEFV
jgi:hypothetical protein